MSDDRKQSPHYIPELDPESKKFPGPSAGELIYFSATLIIMGAAFVYVGLKNGNDITLYLGAGALSFTAVMFVLSWLLAKKRKS